MNFFKLQKQLSNRTDRKQTLIRDVFLSDMKGIIDLYQEDKDTDNLIFRGDFGIPICVVEMNRRIAASLSLVESRGELTCVIRILKEFEDTGIEQLLAETVSIKTGSKVILAHNRLIFQSTGKNISTMYGFDDLHTFNRALSRLIKWLNY